MNDGNESDAPLKMSDVELANLQFGESSETRQNWLAEKIRQDAAQGLIDSEPACTKFRFKRADSGSSTRTVVEPVEHVRIDRKAFAATLNRHGIEPCANAAKWIASAPSDTVAQRQATPFAKASAKPQGVPRADIISGFRLGDEWDERLKKATAGRYAPLAGVWTEKGKQGGAPTLYSPARVGFALMTKYTNEYGRPLRNDIAITETLRRVWPEWLDEWDELRRAGPDRQ